MTTLRFLYQLQCERIIVFVFFFSSTLAFSQTQKELVLGEQPIYKVAKTKDSIIADGKMDEPSWKNAEIRTFDYFFRRDKPADEQKTKFRMLWDDKNLYLFYEFEDSSLTARETQHDGRTYLDDCAEFFCLPIPDSLDMHFGFEVNIPKVKYDYIVLWQFHNNRSIFISSYDPQYEVGVTYDGTLNDDTDIDKGWTMEYIIPLTAFRGFNTRNLAGKKWAFQAVRQDRNLVDDTFRSTSTLFPTYDVILDVHPPNRFGLMEFIEN
ncbi:carbohydrate-binding family 9-like protein [Confluentibacter citreus]|uniref:carbohydrate-binding family 9-like protein n=1 Tax=Confluentibacter citreus TaxID=2007307 RepID=UPI000C294D3E|nr:carbohydrate-binding family 9-like protein [Confluentibacter citreus]